MNLPDAANGGQGVIEVTRKRPIFMGAGSVGWKVFIDGVWVGQAPMGKTVRFQVTPGSHSVKVWSKRGASCSNELDLDIVRGSIRSLKCGVNSLPLGLSKVPEQINFMRNVIKDGGVAKGAFYLYEDTGLLSQ